MHERMKALTKKQKATTAGLARGRRRSAAAVTPTKNQGRKDRACGVVSPLDEWQHLSHVDADAIVHMVQTPLRVNQAMREAKARHATIPQLGK